MNRADETLRKELPTFMVPVYEPLPPCETGRSRLLMAKEGLYIETVQPWGTFRGQLWDSPRPLPYGRIEEKDTFANCLHDLEDPIRNVIEPEAGEYARKGLEWAGWILWSREDGYHYLPLDFEATPTKAKFKAPRLPEGTYLAVDIHSHHRMTPRFSSTDDHDDHARVKITLCLGDYRPHEKERFTMAGRYAIEGFFFDIGEECKDTLNTFPLEDFSCNDTD